MLVGLTIALSLLGIVTFGTVAGSMLPFILRRCGLDPATASAPFVATLNSNCGRNMYKDTKFSPWALRNITNRFCTVRKRQQHRPGH